jgi:fumarylacetoacetate (FAA) hydrolase family protein
MVLRLDARAVLPEDWPAGAYAARVMTAEGPCAVGFLGGEAFDLTPALGTVSRWMEEESPVAAIRARGAPMALDLAALLANSAHHASRRGAEGAPHLLAPIDLQAVKASGVTYVRSMLERVIEERCRGDAARAETVRAEVRAIIGDELEKLRPGSAEAMRVKEALVAKGWWSQYLEVGIGPDAEIFTKCPPMAAVGLGAKVGVHPMSAWSNPEPEAVMVVNSRGRIQGATLGNDVNLRDFEGRSALLLSKAKDNNASCSVGPFVRFFDDTFSLDDVRQTTVTLTVEGEDGFRLEGSSSITKISRDPEDLVAQTVGSHHQYPDGFALLLGTMFAPTQDRGEAGMGFTHKHGDIVTIAAPKLGALTNRMKSSSECEPWTFGIRALMSNLAQRGLINTRQAG